MTDLRDRKSPAAAPSMHRVAVLGLAPVVGYDLVIPPQILGSARDGDGNRLYDVRVVGMDNAPLPTESGYSILPEGDPTWLAEAQTVIIPGTRMPGPRRDGVLGADLAEVLAQIAPGTRMMSICTGAFVLAAAGLLDGRPATTHWAYADAFRSLFPKVRLDEGVLFVDDGDVLSSAGLSAGVDLCLHVVRRDHGTEVANDVARRCVVPPWREGGQAQFIDRAVPPHPEQSTAAARTWALEHLDGEVTIARLAQHAGMSVRTFTRRFRAETGQSPGAWLILQRVRHAQRLLESTSLPVDKVAEKSGFGTGASLRQHLRQHAGVGPTHYRRTFQVPDLVR